MKRNIVVDYRMNNYSGIGTYMRTIIPEIITKLNSTSFHLIINKCNDDIIFADNVKTIKVNSKPYSFKEHFEIPRKVPKNIDLYWSPHYIHPFFLKSKYLLTIHDLYHIKKSNNIFKNIYSYLYFAHIRYYKYNLIAVSNFTKNELLKLKFKKNSITMIHNGLDGKYENLSLENKNYILTVGNLKKNKNILRLVNAYESIQNDINLDLYIVGDYKNIKNKDILALSKIKKNKRIHLLGVLKKEELEKHYNSARFYIHPSIYEGFGYPPLEAMSCGCPVLSSKEGSLSEVCKEGALYFDAYNYEDIALKMRDFLSDDSYREKLINQGSKVILDYRISKTIEKTTELIERIIY